MVSSHFTELEPDALQTFPLVCWFSMCNAMRIFLFDLWDCFSACQTTKLHCFSAAFDKNQEDRTNVTFTPPQPLHPHRALSHWPHAQQHPHVQHLLTLFCTWIFYINSCWKQLLIPKLWFRFSESLKSSLTVSKLDFEHSFPPCLSPTSFLLPT